MQSFNKKTMSDQLVIVPFKYEVYAIRISFVGHRINPSDEPYYFHLIETGDGDPTWSDERAKRAIDSSLSSIKVCKAASRRLEERLRSEYFTSWDEHCDVAEYRSFSRDKMDDLFNKIHDKFCVTGTDIRPKLRGIRWADTWTHKVYEFSFGNLNSSGTIYFGVIALEKNKTAKGDIFDAITCLYKLDFTIGEEKCTERKDEYFLGIPVASETNTSYKTKSLGFATQMAMTNFCRVKALDAFHKRGLTSFVNDCPSIEDV